MRVHFLLFLLCIVTLLEAQQSSDYTYDEIDSLVQIPYSEGDYHGAIEYMEIGMNKAKAEYGEMDTLYAMYMDNLGFFYSELGQYPKAEKYYKKAGNIWKQTLGESSPDYGTSVNNLAILYYRTGQFEEAVVCFRKGLTIYEALVGKAHPEYAHSLSNLANVYEAMGRYEEVEPLYLEAFEIRKKTLGKMHPAYAGSLNELGTLYSKTNRLEEAEALYLEAKSIREQLFGDKHPQYAVSVHTLANLKYEQGQYFEAEKLYKEGLVIVKESLGENHPYYATSLNNLGNLYRKMGMAEKTEKYLLEAVGIYKNVHGEFHYEYANGLNNLANLYLSMDKIDLAIAHCIAGIAVNAEDFDQHFPTLFDIHRDLNEGKYLPAACCQGLAQIDFSLLANINYVHDHQMNVGVLTLLGILNRKYDLSKIEKARIETIENNLKQYYDVNRAGMEINKQIRNDFSGNENKLRMLKLNKSFVKFGIATALELNEKKYIEEAFEYAEQNKSILLADALKGNRARSMGDLPDSLAQLEIDLLAQKDALKKQKIEAKNEDERSKIRVKENELNQEINNFLNALKNKFPKYHALKYENITAKVADVQALLDEKTLLLEYFIADTVTYLFAIQKNKLQLIPISIKKDSLTNQIKALRKALTNYNMLVKNHDVAYGLYTRSAYWFYHKLLAKALKDTAIRNLIIIADGELGHLPFEVFLVERAAQKFSSYADLHYLLNDYNVSYNYAATLFLNKVQTKQNRTPKKEMLACAAYYGKLDSTLLDIRTQEDFDLRKVLHDLPQAQAEVKAISKIFEGDFLYEREDLEKKGVAGEAFFKAQASQYRIIHLAMHGLLNTASPMLSSLAFTENGDSTENNYLQAFEISKLELNADLVVLSACETGYGEFQQGEGILSLARSFMYAGTPSLVVSLWQVNDQSTATIMKTFYEQLSEGKPKDIALRAAKLDYVQKSSGIAGHPALWSAFIQLGDNQPLKFQKKGGLFWWGIAGCLFLLFGILGVKRMGRKG